MIKHGFKLVINPFQLILILLLSLLKVLKKNLQQTYQTTI